MIPDSRIVELEERVANLLDRLKGFKPVVVELRIDGIVRPVTLFALDAKLSEVPGMNPPTKGLFHILPLPEIK